MRTPNVYTFNYIGLHLGRYLKLFNFNSGLSSVDGDHNLDCELPLCHVLLPLEKVTRVNPGHLTWIMGKKWFEWLLVYQKF